MRPVRCWGPLPLSDQASGPVRATAASVSSRSANGAPAACAFVGRHCPRHSRIERHAVGIARPRSGTLALGDQRGDLASALEARIQEARGFELGEGRPVIAKALALPPHRLAPGNAEPVQVLIDGGLVFRAATRRIDVLDAQ
jgi:hypothetical protein